MVTSLCAGLYLHLTSDSNTTPAPKSRPDHSTLEMIHNLAQYVHSLAQGKVGSGFDVSAAVWGSQVYRRFSEICLAALLATKSDVQVSLSLPLSRLSNGTSDSVYIRSGLRSIAVSHSFPKVESTLDRLGYFCGRHSVCSTTSDNAHSRRC